jgi:tRNA-splicing ligase RtcB
MADHHLGYAVPVGGVIAYGEHLSPSGCGFDIGCGNKAVRLDADADRVRADIAPLMDSIWQELSFGVGRKNATPVEHLLFDDDPAWAIPEVAALKDMAAAQLGTIGSGNHYVDLFVDEAEQVWVGVHFGCRGLGHKLASHFIKAGGGQDGIHVDPVLLHQDSDLGQQYLACMQLAGRYAYAGRDWVCARVAEILGSEVLEEVHNHHNYIWRETHGGREVWVVRKGATPAFAGQRGFVGGTMGDLSVILEGVEDPTSPAAMHSTVHGAGRAMSRTEAAGKYKGWGAKRTLVRPGKISTEMMAGWLADFGGVELRGGGLDEAPQAYKRLPEVLAAHAGSLRVLHTLRPLGVAMAGFGEFDPYKD